MGMTQEDRQAMKGSGPTFNPGAVAGARATPITQAYAAAINDASAFSGLSRSEIYRCLADGKIRAIKSGKRTLILMDSLRDHLASLPAATFASPKTQATA
jgi:excisionase family DNA binding protein